jgi:hypothetical protein
MLDLARHLTVALVLNYKEFLYSCSSVKLIISKDLFNVLTDVLNTDIVKHRRHPLREPDVLALIAHLEAVLVVDKRMLNPEAKS